MDVLLYIAIGLAAGIVSGFVGIGGGSLVIPMLVLLAGMTQHQAQGTTLGMLVPPIGILAAITYYRAGYINIKVAAILCIGFFIGGFIGAKIAIDLPEKLLRRIFAIYLIIIAIQMFFKK